jgi:eight-cysteine-cluster-containing protein
MKKIISIIIILIILISGYFLFFNKTQPTDEEIVQDNLNVIIRDMSEVPSEYFSGDSRYSHGECKQDHECKMAGCNLEMCTSDENIVTTCEIGGDFPDKIKYNCGCIKDKCGWYER